MLNEIFMRSFCCLLITILSYGAAFAQNLKVAPGWHSSIVLARDVQAPESGAPFFTNLVLDPCTGCNYDANAGGYYVWGVNNCISPGTTQWIAVPFFASRTGVPSSIVASILLDPCGGTSTEVTLGIWTDACGQGPGSQLASANATVPATPCHLAKATLQGAPSITAGSKYWIVATTQGATQDGLSAIWYASNTSQIGGNVANGGWFQFSGFVPGFGVRSSGGDPLN